MRIILCIIAAEALTQLLCKAEIFDHPRSWIQSRGWWAFELLACPYCMSVWCAAFIIGSLALWEYARWFVWILAVHRCSNFLHDLYGVIINTKINLVLRRG